MPGAKIVVKMTWCPGIELSHFEKNSSYENNKHFGVWPKYYS